MGLKEPPGRVVQWMIRYRTEGVKIGEGKTAYEAAASVGLKLEQCVSIDWVSDNTHSEPEPEPESKSRSRGNGSESK